MTCEFFAFYSFKLAVQEKHISKITKQFRDFINEFINYLL